MAIGRALSDQGFHERPPHRKLMTGAATRRRRWKWRHLALVLVALIVAIMASLSLILDPPASDGQPSSPSYLPSELPPVP